jgi:hypothetical protein
MVAAAGPAPSAPRWGYAYMNRATETEAPIGVLTELNNAFQWSTEADPGWAGTVTHLATGEYEVRLPGIGGSGGIAHVTPYRTDNTGRGCAVRGYRAVGADELIRVGCVDRTGARVDWWFTVFYAAPATGADPYATLRYDVPGGGVSVPAVANDGTFNSAGRVNRVVRDGVGRYQPVRLGDPGALRPVRPYPGRRHPGGEHRLLRGVLLGDAAARGHAVDPVVRGARGAARCGCRSGGVRAGHR